MGAQQPVGDVQVKSVVRMAAILGIGLLLAVPAYASQDVVLVLDNSGSMRANDPNRLVPKAVTDFVSSQGADSRVAIIEFATNPKVLMPLTPVSDNSRSQTYLVVQQLDYRGQWTDIGAALERALYELDQHGRSDAQKYVVLMTDGRVDVGSDARDSDKIHWITQSLIPEAVSKHVRIFGVAFTDQADYELLQTLAEKTGAAYFRAYQADDLGDIYRRISDTLQNAKAVPEPVETEAAAPAPAVAPGGVAFNTPLTPAPQVQQGGSLLWLWAILLFVALGIAAGAYFFWSKGGMKLFLKTPQTTQGQPEGVQAVLYDISNPNDIKRYELGEKSTVIGRVAGYDPEVQYVLAAEPTVGRSHALIERRGHSFWITDQGSINGTFVNGERVTGDRALKHGDIVAVHRHEFEFVLPELFESEATVLAAREEYGYGEKREA